MLKRLLLLLFVVFSCLPAMAGEPSEDIFHESGKIYVVVAVITIVFIGIIIYLLNLDRKVAKLEKELKNKQ